MYGLMENVWKQRYAFLLEFNLKIFCLASELYRIFSVLVICTLYVRNVCIMCTLCVH